jgi:Actin
MSTTGAATSASDDPAAAAAGGSTMLLLNQPIVIDNGTGSIKAGFAGSSKPKVGVDKLMNETGMDVMNYLQRLRWKRSHWHILYTPRHGTCLYRQSLFFSGLILPFSLRRL